MIPACRLFSRLAKGLLDKVRIDLVPVCEVFKKVLETNGHLSLSFKDADRTLQTPLKVRFGKERPPMVARDLTPPMAPVRHLGHEGGHVHRGRPKQSDHALSQTVYIVLNTPILIFLTLIEALEEKVIAIVGISNRLPVGVLVRHVLLTQTCQEPLKVF